MKKVTAAILAMIMLAVSVVPCLADESDVNYFESTIGDSTSLTADEWMSDDLHRAMLAVFVFFEYYANVDTEVATEYNLYGGVIGSESDSDTIVLLIPGVSKDALMMLYSVSLDAVFYGIVEMDGVSSDICYHLLQMDDDITEYYYLDEDSVATVLDMMTSAVSSDD